MKNIRVFYLKIFGFLEVKFSIYLNRRVFVMNGTSFIFECNCKTVFDKSSVKFGRCRIRLYAIKHS